MHELDKSTGTVAAMFNSIAWRYDFLNKFLSFGIDRFWRRCLLRRVALGRPQRVLDLATGTADLSVGLARRLPETALVGVDISDRMLEIGRRKVEKKRLAARVDLQKGSAMALPFADATFDCVMVAFGVRNFEDLTRGLAQANRVLRHGGYFYVLEFSTPVNRFVRAIYNLYLKLIVCRLGGWISRNKLAYNYLFESIESFPCGDNFIKLMRDANFVNCSAVRLFFGVATIYFGVKAV